MLPERAVTLVGPEGCDRPKVSLPTFSGGGRRVDWLPPAVANPARSAMQGWRIKIKLGPVVLAHIDIAASANPVPVTLLSRLPGNLVVIVWTGNGGESWHDIVFLKVGGWFRAAPC